MDKVIIAPSLLAANFLNLEKEIFNVEKSGAKFLHFDVMDGQFVNNISFGIPVLKSISKSHHMVNDVHLMILNPKKYALNFINAGANIITVHYETISKEDFDYLRDICTQNNVKLGLAIKPKSLVSEIVPFLKNIDLVLVMSVEPGFGGQKFIESSIEKIKELNKIKNENHYDFLIEVDGGINNVTSKKCIDAGANVLVAGSYIFKAKDYREAIEDLL